MEVEAASADHENVGNAGKGMRGRDTLVGKSERAA